MVWLILWNFRIIISVVAGFIGMISVGFFAGIGIGVFVFYLCKIINWVMLYRLIPKLLDKE